MIKIKYRVAVIVLLSLVFLQSCGDQSETVVDFGEYDSGYYTNAFFNEEILQTISLS